jgi:prepilin-type N-terminal cleavage/methylation domain-containing protein
MKTQKTQIDTSSIRRRSKRGFSLIELTVAMTMFLVVGGAAVSLIKSHQPLFGAQQSQVGLNLSLRNSVAQMQNDVENAGTGFYQGVDLPAFPFGVMVSNNSAGSTNCYDPTTHTYGPTCFDSFTVVSIDNSIPLAHPAAPCSPVPNSSTLFIQPQDPLISVGTLAGDFHNGDNILIVSGDGSTMVDTILTKDGTVSGGNTHLDHNPTGTGTTQVDAGLFNNDLNSNNKILQNFCSNDWVLRIQTIKYSVDASNPANPKLMRTTSGGSSDIVAEQIIGFKVGAYNDVTSSYSYNSSNQSTDNPPGYNNDWTQVRSLRISVIGRSNPVGDPTFQNKFDQGNYYVESAAVVINPRNLSMNK